jgi:hypothetical protein
MAWVEAGADMEFVGLIELGRRDLLGEAERLGRWIRLQVFDLARCFEILLAALHL